MKTQWSEWCAEKEANEQNARLIIEGMIDRLSIWVGLGAIGVGLVSMIVGLLTHNQQLMTAGISMNAVGSGSIMTGVYSRKHESNEGGNPYYSIANHPAVQREANRLNLSQSQLMSIVDKIANFLNRLYLL